MVYSQSTALNTFTRQDVVLLAEPSVQDVITVDAAETARREFDQMSLCFGLGIIFTIAAIAFGSLL